MEQEARHVDTTQKREKPKGPPKRRTDSHHTAMIAERDAEDEEFQIYSNGEAARIRDGGMQEEKHSQQHFRSSTQGSGSKEITPLVSPTREHLSDPNDADQSGVDETENGGDTSTSRDGSDEKPRIKMSNATQRVLKPLVRSLDARAERGDNEDDEGEEEEDEADGEEDIDPEITRKMEIRERMVKMSGGMGMVGMFGPPGGMPFLSGKKQKASGSNARGLLPNNIWEMQTQHPFEFNLSWVCLGCKGREVLNSTTKKVKSRTSRICSLPRLLRVEHPSKHLNSREMRVKLFENLGNRKREEFHHRFLKVCF